jgi:hypothetical protein
MDSIVNVSNYFGHKCAFHFATGEFEGEEDWDLVLFDITTHHECSVPVALPTPLSSRTHTYTHARTHTHTHSLSLSLSLSSFTPLSRPTLLTFSSLCHNSLVSICSTSPRALRVLSTSRSHHACHHPLNTHLYATQTHPTLQLLGPDVQCSARLYTTSTHSEKQRIWHRYSTVPHSWSRYVLLIATSLSPWLRTNKRACPLVQMSSGR